MKKSLMICALLLSCASYTMDDDLESGYSYSPQPQYRQRTSIQYSTSPRGPKYGAKIEVNDSSSYVVKYMPQPKKTEGLFNILLGPSSAVNHLIEFVIPGRNITLWENSLDSYDVIYRRDDGVVVAKNIETGEELYAIGLERTQGDEKEELLQTDEGSLLVSNRDGTVKKLSHKALKNRVLPESVRGHGCADADKSDGDE